MRLSEPISFHLPIIRCRCGVEILLVPDVKLMSKAIETHVDEHKQKTKNGKAARAEAEQTRNDLIVKVLAEAVEA